MTVASTTQADKVVDSRFTLLKLWRIVAQFAEYDLMAGSGNATALFARELTRRPAWQENSHCKLTVGYQRRRLLSRAHQAESQDTCFKVGHAGGAHTGRHWIYLISRI